MTVEVEESQCRVVQMGAPVAETPWPLPGGGSSKSFGIGAQRSLEEYESASGVNFREQRLEAKALRGGDGHKEEDFLEKMKLTPGTQDLSQDVSQDVSQDCLQGSIARAFACPGTSIL